MCEVIIRFKSATRHKRVGDAGGGGASELYSYVEIIILFQKRILKDVEYIPLMLVPVFVGKLCGDAFELLGKPFRAGDLIIPLQHGTHAVAVLLTKLPQANIAGVLACAGVGNIENVFQLRVVAGRVYDRDAF
ncbi:MAG: hypothetical protein GX847_10105 [Clostridiales bacterium]|nr:hypothetical protein [Clostridiales bacterium]